MRAAQRALAALRHVAMFFAVAWIVLHLLLWGWMTPGVLLRWPEATGAARGAAIWSSLALLAVGLLGILALVWAFRLWGPRDHERWHLARRWCLALGGAYAALYLAAWWLFGTGPWSGPVAWRAMLGLGGLLVGASLIVGLPFTALLGDPLPAAVLYVSALAMGVAVPPPPWPAQGTTAGTAPSRTCGRAEA